MVDIYSTTERCFFRECAHKIFRAAPRLHFLLQVRQCFDEKERRHTGRVEGVKPDGFIGGERLKCGFIEQNNWSRAWHLDLNLFGNCVGPNARRPEPTAEPDRFGAKITRRVVSDVAQRVVPAAARSSSAPRESSSRAAHFPRPDSNLTRYRRPCRLCWGCSSSGHCCRQCSSVTGQFPEAA